MAKETVVICRDDISGAEGAETVEFSLDGQFFTIDLAEENAQRLRGALAEFIAAATPAPWPDAGAMRARKRRKTPGSIAASPQTIRAWWNDPANREAHNLPPFNDRGRIPGPVEEAYAATH